MARPWEKYAVGLAAFLGGAMIGFSFCMSLTH